MNAIHFNGVSYSASIYSYFSYFSTAISKVALLGTESLLQLGLYLGAGLVSGYQFYQGYQCRLNNPYHLDKRHKLVKCQALLQQAEELKKLNSTSNILPGLNECYELLNTIKQDVCTANEILELKHKLSLLYAEYDSNRSYALVQYHNCKYQLIDVALNLHQKQPDFDQNKLGSLLERALSDQVSDATTSTPCSRILKWNFLITEAALKLNLTYLADRALDHASALIKTFVDVDKISGLCQMAKKFKDLNKHDKMVSCLEEAQTSLKSLPEEKVSQAERIMASTYTECEYAHEWREGFELESKQRILNNQVILTKGDLENTKWIIGAIGKDKLLAENQELAEAMMRNLDQTIVANTETDDILDIAKIYLLLGAKEKALEAAEYAFKVIQKNSQNEADNDYVVFQLKDIIKFFSYKESPNRVEPMMKMLEQLYDQTSFEARVMISKDLIAHTIMNLYNKMKLKDKAQRMFEKHISESLQHEKRPFEKINRLVHQGLHDQYTIEQKKAVLEIAEKLLPDVNSISRPLANAIIAEAYLKVDPQRSIQLIEQYQNSKGAMHYVNGSVFAAAMAILFALPAKAPLILMGAGVIGSALALREFHGN